MADALASGASVRKDVRVQVPPSAPIKLGFLKIRAFLLCLENTGYAGGSEKALAITRDLVSFVDIMMLRSGNCNKQQKEDIQMNDNNSLAHTSWNCKYHIVFAPKYRRKIFYKEMNCQVKSDS